MIRALTLAAILFAAPFIAYALARWVAKPSTPWPMKTLTAAGLVGAIIGMAVMGATIDGSAPPAPTYAIPDPEDS